MKKLLNTLYINKNNRYLSLDGETVAVFEKDTLIGRVPLHNIQSIVTVGYTGASPALMGECAKRGIDLVFLSSHGRFLARVVGEVKGNVLLRKEQYRISNNQEKSNSISKNIILAKLYNSRAVLKRAKRDYPQRIDINKISDKINMISDTILKIQKIENIDSEQLRGYEGKAADVYFSIFNDLILQQKDSFYFETRNKRPPLDNVNALLSFAYSMLAGMCSSALETVGLDPYVGFLHTDRPGRISLALDLMEEFRECFADRFVITIINKKIINEKHFTVKENGAVILTDEGRKIFFDKWEYKKNEELNHPFLNEKMEWGMMPYAQALLLARFIRGDLDEYPPFFWK